MLPVEYSVKNIYRYSRKSYKNDANSIVNAFTESRGVDVLNNTVVPACSCEMDSKAMVEDIIHKKCPIIALAQQQYQRIIDETDRILYENGSHRRSLHDILVFFKEVVTGDNNRVCVLGFLVAISFTIGILLGSASCGTHLRKFSSPVFACIEHLIVDSGKISDETAIY